MMRMAPASVGLAIVIAPYVMTGAAMQTNQTLTAVEGIKVGHHTLTTRPTGCTVIIAEAGAVAGVDVRGAAPGTRETDLLNPVNTVQQVHAIVLSGGSAFGLAAADGTMRYLDEKGIGFPIGGGVVPIVTSAILYDLNVGDRKIRPDAACGYEAARAATNAPVAEGNVGAGAGAARWWITFSSSRRTIPAPRSFASNRTTARPAIS